MTGRADNSEAYGTIRWILDNGDMGFFLVTGFYHQQKKVAERYKSRNVAIYDYSNESKPFSYAELSKWADSQKEENALFILNLDLALENKDHMAAFNISRNLLSQKEKIWVFFMTEEMNNRLAAFAHDIYSYVRLKVHFHSEEEEEFEGKYILDFDGRHNVHQIRETLKRYSAPEAKYMAMNFKENSESQLLSAAVALLRMAILYDDCGEYDHALRLLEKVGKIRRKILGEKHPDTATTYNNIAGIYDKQRDYDKALEWYQKVLVIDEKILGKKHPDTATTYNNIAGVYDKQRDYDKALEWYKKTLVICESAMGKEHPNTAITYNNIAFVYDNQGDYNKALEWYQKALVVCENVMGKKHPVTARAYNNIATVYGRQGDYSKAFELYKNAYEILLRKLGGEHLSTKITKENIQLLNQILSQGAVS